MNTRIILAASDSVDEARDFEKAVKKLASNANVFLDTESSKKDLEHQNISWLYVVRKGEAGCAFFDAEGKFSDALLCDIQKLLGSFNKAQIGFVLCYQNDAKRASQRDWKRLIKNQPELRDLSKNNRVHFIDHVVSGSKITFRLKKPLERKRGLVRVWNESLPKITLLIECLPSTSGRLEWNLVKPTDDRDVVKLGVIKYNLTTVDIEDVSCDMLQRVTSKRALQHNTIEIEVKVTSDYEDGRFEFV